MAQQTTQFPPGGNLTNWVPGFSSAGHPIRGLRVDNTSGSWLSVVIPSLPVQFIPPYTLAWSMTLLTPLSNVTINSGGPPNSFSTAGGTNVTVYAYTESAGDSNGNTYYTPIEQSRVLWKNDQRLVAPKIHTSFLLMGGFVGQSFRILYFSAFPYYSDQSQLYSSYTVYLRITGIGNPIIECEINPAKPTFATTCSLNIDVGLGVSWDIVNNSIDRSQTIGLIIHYTVS